MRNNLFIYIRLQRSTTSFRPDRTIRPGSPQNIRRPLSAPSVRYDKKQQYTPSETEWFPNGKNRMISIRYSSRRQENRCDQAPALRRTSGQDTKKIRPAKRHFASRPYPVRRPFRTETDRIAMNQPVARYLPLPVRIAAEPAVCEKLQSVPQKKRNGDTPVRIAVPIRTLRAATRRGAGAVRTSRRPAAKGPPAPDGTRASSRPAPNDRTLRRSAC